MPVSRRRGVYLSGSDKPDKTKKADKSRWMTVPALAGSKREMNLQEVLSPSSRAPGYDGISVLGVARALLFGGKAFRGYNFRCRVAVAENRAERRNEIVRNSI